MELWWGRWDLNPGSHAPQACILFWTQGNSRRKLENPEELSKLDDDPALNDYVKPVIKTIETLKKKGKKYNTLRSVFYTLRELNKHIDLMNPEANAVKVGRPKPSRSLAKKRPVN